MKEIIMLAVSQLKDDRFRTLLSLLGVTVGIFAVVTVFTLVDSLQKAIDDGFKDYGADICFLEKIPIEPDLNENGLFQWWNYLGRPDVSYREYKYLKSKMGYGNITFKCSTSDGVIGICSGWEMLIHEKTVLGRPFTEKELDGADVLMIGENIRQKYFDAANPVGKYIRLYGREFKIVGVFETSGTNIVSTVDTDNSYIIPYNALESVTDMSMCECSIVFQGIDEEEVRLMMRQYRRLKPWEEDDFAINRLSFVLKEINDIIDIVNKFGWIVGIFSLAVGAFGIANIMYVSVEERKKEIGIQKALGAKRGIITIQYLTESAVLAIMGGMAGILLVGAISVCIPEGLIAVRLSISNALLGLCIALSVGIVSGVAPAFRAASLNPVEAINAC